MKQSYVFIVGYPNLFNSISYWYLVFYQKERTGLFLLLQETDQSVVVPYI